MSMDELVLYNGLSFLLLLFVELLQVIIAWGQVGVFVYYLRSLYR